MKFHSVIIRSFLSNCTASFHHNQAIAKPAAAQGLELLKNYLSLRAVQMQAAASIISPPPPPSSISTCLGFPKLPIVPRNRNHSYNSINFNSSSSSRGTRVIKSQLLSTDHHRMASSSSTPRWAQKTVTIPAQKRGCHLITSKILKEIGPELSEFQCGLAHLFLQHTSASLTLNENYDSDVRADTETFLNRVVPEGTSAPWRHTLEGPDDMPAHIKSSMFGCSLTIPITGGKLNMGTWQGIWLCEHRDVATPRRVVITLNGI